MHLKDEEKYKLESGVIFLTQLKNNTHSNTLKGWTYNYSRPISWVESFLLDQVAIPLMVQGECVLTHGVLVLVEKVDN